MFKLYYRDDDGKVTDYYEIWVEPENRRIIQHWGPVGDQGEAKPHRIWMLRSLDEQVEALLQPAREAGYQELTLEDHVWLIVEYAIDAKGTEDDLDKRHALEDRLQEVLGWTGLGHCDGGRISSGAMEAACPVVDFELAKTVIAEALAGSEFEDYARIYPRHG